MEFTKSFMTQNYYPVPSKPSVHSNFTVASVNMLLYNMMYMIYIYIYKIHTAFGILNYT